MRISAQGIALIKEFEGLYLTAYKCPADVWTIGWGCTDGVRPGQRITEAQAETLLRTELSRFEAGVNRLVKVALSQSEFDALVSFAYNVGLGEGAIVKGKKPGGLKHSTLLAKLNQGDRLGAAAEFPRWNKVKGKASAGLIRRRAAEQKLFLSQPTMSTDRYKATQPAQITLSGGATIDIPTGTVIEGAIANGVIQLAATTPAECWEQLREAIALTISKATVLKATPSSSLGLGPGEKHSIAPGVITVNSVSPAVGKHLKVELPDPIKGRSLWYIYAGHVDAATLPDYKAPHDDGPEPTPDGPAIDVPGVGRVALGAAIVRGGNFTWAEATKNGTRVPESTEVARAIVGMAGKMQQVRGWLGDRSITVTSWYRPPAVNKAVGGARNSTHLRGCAVDFVVAGLTPGQVQRILDPKWPGGLGYGRSFTHLDDRGYRARWNYGG